jgi:anti-anti-sigma factor
MTPARYSPDDLNDDRATSVFYRHEFKGGVLMVRPAGPNLGQREAVILNAEITAILKQLGARLRLLLLDLTDVQAMASFGLGVCIELRNVAQTRHAPTVVYGLNNDLAALFRLMKVERLYTIVHSPKELAKALAA